MTPKEQVERAVYDALKPFEDKPTNGLALLKAAHDALEELASCPYGTVSFHHISTPEDIRCGRLILEIVPEESDPLLMQEFIAAQYLASDQGRAMRERLAA